VLLGPQLRQPKQWWRRVRRGRDGLHLLRQDPVIGVGNRGSFPRRWQKALGIVLFVAAGGTGLASPVRVKNGSTVFVSVKGKREAGIGLRPKNGVWRVELSGSSGLAGESVELVDITENAHNTKWVLYPTDGTVTLDSQRVVAGHAYRMTVMRNGASLASALIYLYPPSASAKSRVKFDAAETSGSDSDDTMVAKKPSL
jgi:hypothetical protein